MVNNFWLQYHEDRQRELLREARKARLIAKLNAAESKPRSWWNVLRPHSLSEQPVSRDDER